MTEATMEPFTRPDDEITIIPKDFKFGYLGHSDSEDAISIHVTDERVGSVALVMNAASAHHVAQHLAAMVAGIDQLREEHDRRIGKGDN
ncbi:hypothetical protein [Mycobacterium nebraskense]|uniref:hypothetical protein n=1 Tax=Mycobacterium nebraskense TaxID=244292 RepID=UPI000617BD8F|nr:hypothetical protein [Mycobacterium nebraskense]KKC04537.1 hypothetical protein WU83_13235 [Mycobacterium nebraskense]